MDGCVYVCLCAVLASVSPLCVSVCRLEVSTPEGAAPAVVVFKEEVFAAVTVDETGAAIAEIDITETVVVEGGAVGGAGAATE